MVDLLSKKGNSCSISSVVCQNFLSEQREDIVEQVFKRALAGLTMLRSSVDRSCKAELLFYQSVSSFTQGTCKTLKLGSTKI